MMVTARLPLMFVLASTLGCATVPIEPLDVAVADREAAFDRGLRGLVREGFEIATHDRQAGIIQTEWLEVRNIGGVVTEVCGELSGCHPTTKIAKEIGTEITATQQHIASSMRS